MPDISKEELVRFLAVEGMGLKPWGEPEDFCFWPAGKGTPFRWDPLTDANDLLMLVEAMKNKEWQLNLHTGLPLEPNLASFINHRITSLPDETTTLDKDLKNAVCRAAYKALKIAKETA